MTQGGRNSGYWVILKELEEQAAGTEERLHKLRETKWKGVGDKIKNILLEEVSSSKLFELKSEGEVDDLEKKENNSL